MAQIIGICYPFYIIPDINPKNSFGKNPYTGWTAEQETVLVKITVSFSLLIILCILTLQLYCFLSHGFEVRSLNNLGIHDCLSGGLCSTGVF